MFRVIAIATLIAMTTLACSEPPDKERQQAERALTAAQAADAATYAPDELHAAESAFQKYGAAVDARDYRQALALAVEARDGAYRATKDATDEKASARSQAERLVTDLESLARAGQARLSGTNGPKLTVAAADHVRAVLVTAASLLQEARSQVAQQNYRAAVAALAPVVAALQSDVNLAPAASARRAR
jgi:hypothetical protein